MSSTRGDPRRRVRLDGLSIINGQAILLDMAVMREWPSRWDGHIRTLEQVPALRMHGGRAVDASGSNGPAGYGVLHLYGPHGEISLLVLEQRTHLSYDGAERIVSEIRYQNPQRVVLFAPYVGPEMGRFLADRGVNYVDAVGNLNLQLEGGIVASFGGARPPRQPAAAKALRAPAYQTLFALVAEPALAAAPVREIARRAGVSKSTVADSIARLVEEARVVAGPSGRRVVDRRGLLGLLEAGYVSTLRPALAIGSFEPPAEDTAGVERFVSHAFTQRNWRFGGGAACDRMTQYWRGDQTVVHVDAKDWRVAPMLAVRHLRLPPARSGRLEVLTTPGPIGLEGPRPDVAHPLLVYLELATGQDDRARDAAAVVRERFLPWSLA